MTALILLSEFQKTEVETWKPIEGFSGYDISSLGRVRTYWTHPKNSGMGRNWMLGTTPVIKQITGGVATNGYSKVELRRNGKAFHLRVHRLVAKAFIANPENHPEVGHKNAVRHDCRAANLEWTTRRDNMIHSHLYSNLASHKVDVEAVKVIRTTPRTPGSGRVLSERYNVSASTISEIRSGKRRKFIK